MSMNMGMCFFDRFDPQQYIFVNKSLYHVRFDFFKNGLKFGVVLLPIQKARNLEKWIADLHKKVYSTKLPSEVGKREYFLSVIQKNQTIELGFESYKTVKCKISFDKKTTQDFVRFIHG